LSVASWAVVKADQWADQQVVYLAFQWAALRAACWGDPWAVATEPQLAVSSVGPKVEM
jgi:hypothetical protein